MEKGVKTDLGEDSLSTESLTRRWRGRTVWKKMVKRVEAPRERGAFKGKGSVWGV